MVEYFWARVSFSDQAANGYFFDYLNRGRTVDYFLEQFPTANRVQVEQLLDEAKTNSLPQRVSI